MHYLEDSLELLEHLPEELRKKCKELQQLDAQYSVAFDKLQRDSRHFFDTIDQMTPIGAEQKNSELLLKFQSVREIGEAKVRVAEYLKLTLEKYQERVAKDLAEFKAELESENPGETELIEKNFMQTMLAMASSSAERFTDFLDNLTTDRDNLEQQIIHPLRPFVSAPVENLNDDEESRTSTEVDIATKGHRTQQFDEFRIPTTLLNRRPSLADAPTTSSGASLIAYDEDIFDAEMAPPAKKLKPTGTQIYLPQIGTVQQQEIVAMEQQREGSASSISTISTTYPSSSYTKIDFDGTELGPAGAPLLSPHHLRHPSLVRMPLLAGAHSSRHGRTRKLTKKVEQMLNEGTARVAGPFRGEGVGRTPSRANSLTRSRINQTGIKRRRRRRKAFGEEGMADQLEETVEEDEDNFSYQDEEEGNYTYPLVLKACSCMHALQLGRWVHATILYNELHRKIKPNVYVHCAVIDMFVKCGSLEDARSVFEEMPDRDLASWTSMICGTMWNGELLEALSLFRKMRSEEGLKPDSVVVASVLSVCGRLEAVKLGMALQGCAVRSGFDSDLYVSNTVIDMYCKCGDPLEAHRVFSHMLYRDVVSWSTLIAGYSQNRLYQESYKLYVEMVNVGLTTNAVVATSVLPALGKLKLLKPGKEMHNFVLKEGLVSDVVVGSALIDMYANCESIKEAESVFGCMSDKDIMVWNSMIVGYNLVGDFESAFFTFRRIWEAEHRPNSITLVSVLPICTQLGALRQGKEIHGYVTKSGLGLNVSVGNSLIDMYSKCGFLELGVKVFNQMMERNVITYNTMISACGAHGLGEKGLAFYEQMKEAGIRPNKLTFISLLSACSHAGLLDRGWLLYNSMINDYGIEPDTEHYSCMVDLIARTGDLDGAYKFITKMPMTPDANVLGSLLGACRLHNKVELAELLTERIFQLNADDPGHFVLLSNLYASGKRWEDMSKVRSMIKDKGLEKKPGSSWIQVGHCIYVFHATSSFHPAFAKIEETLKNLLLVMKSENYMLTNVNDQLKVK